MIESCVILSKWHSQLKVLAARSVRQRFHVHGLQNCLEIAACPRRPNYQEAARVPNRTLGQVTSAALGDEASTAGDQEASRPMRRTCYGILGLNSGTRLRISSITAGFQTTPSSGSKACAE